jgi:hypothetical protein
MSDPLDIAGVDTANVGKPRNDGTPGSALYAVPVKLTRPPTSREAQLLLHYWDNPPSFSTMHRPGIARVSGDSLVLDGTTVDEVKEVHAKTMRLVVDATNAHEAQLRTEDETKRAAQEAQSESHQQHVEDVAKDIEF